jgi:hypothetical protein
VVQRREQIAGTLGPSRTEFLLDLEVGLYEFVLELCSAACNESAGY